MKKVSIHIKITLFIVLTFMVFSCRDESMDDLGYFHDPDIYGNWKAIEYSYNSYYMDMLKTDSLAITYYMFYDTTFSEPFGTVYFSKISVGDQFTRFERRIHWNNEGIAHDSDFYVDRSGPMIGSKINDNSYIPYDRYFEYILDQDTIRQYYRFNTGNEMEQLELYNLYTFEPMNPDSDIYWMLPGEWITWNKRRYVNGLFEKE